MTIVCIAGMHRSGTSMVSRLLNLAGVHLGDPTDMHPAAADNPHGYWEHASFVELNEALLEAAGTGWGLHLPLEAGWLERPEVAALVPAARELAGAMATEASVWGWKDPRNSLTLPFWQRVLEDDIVVIHCLRHPDDVRRSLDARGQDVGIDAWFDYNDHLLERGDLRRIVTHYDAFFEDPRAELVRLLEFIGLAADDASLDAACATINPESRHNRSAGDLPDPGVAGMYAALCEAAGFRAAALDPMLAAAAAERGRLRRRADELQRISEDRRRELVAAGDHIDRITEHRDSLQSQLDTHVALVNDLRAQLGAITSSRSYRIVSRMTGARHT